VAATGGITVAGDEFGTLERMVEGDAVAEVA